MMEREARRIRTAIQRQQALRAGTATRYPAEVRRQAVAFTCLRLEAGKSLKSIARGLGLRPQLLHYWHSKFSRARFRPVKVGRATAAGPRESARLVLVTPRGFRVDGLDVNSLAVLLRALS